MARKQRLTAVGALLAILALGACETPFEVQDTQQVPGDFLVKWQAQVRADQAEPEFVHPALRRKQ